jgi:dihydropteroate synthase
MIRILEVSNLTQAKRIMQEIKVDPYGIEIMAPKAMHYLVRLNSISNIAANILKQDMLSLGGDVAVSRGALTGQVKKTDCLIMGNYLQFNLLAQKISRQPFGLNKVSEELLCSLKNYSCSNFILKLGKHKLDLGKRVHLMGVLNLTPDSFSGDGLYSSAMDRCLLAIENQAQRMVQDGADIIDIGGESTRPGAKAVSVKEEIKRVLPVIKLLAKKINVPISVDTYKPEVAKAVLDNGALIINDITGLRSPAMAKVVAKYKAGLVIMHMKGTPTNMQNNPKYKSLIVEIIEFLNSAINRAHEAGIDKDKIIIDPGVGFGKTLEHNLEILNKLSEFKVLGRSILIGTSRKSFIGKVLDANPNERLIGTISSCVLAALAGASILRVHDIKEVKDALKIYEAING